MAIEIDEACDFYHIAHVLQDALPGKQLKDGSKKGCSQACIIESVFYSYTYQDGKEAITFHPATIGGWFHGQEPVSRNIKDFYDDHPGLLAQDIYHQILPKLPNPRKVSTALIQAYMADEYISEEKKFDFENQFFPRNREPVFSHVEKDGIPDWDSQVIAGILQDAISTQYPVRDKETHRLMLPSSPMERLVNYIPEPCLPFLGRAEELAEIDRLFEKHCHIFLYGLSGYGKSELAKAYAQARKLNYLSIVYIHYSGDLKKDIANLHFIGEKKPNAQTWAALRSTGLTSTEGITSIDFRYETHMEILRSLNKRSLIIIDNFDILPYSIDRAETLPEDDRTVFQQEELLPNLLQLPCRIMFCTRCNPAKWAAPLGKLEIQALDMKSLMQVVTHFFPDAPAHKKAVKEIINILERNTMLVKMAAVLLEDSIWEPEAILEQLETDNLGVRISDHIGMETDGAYTYASFSSHARTLFKLYVLSDLHKDTLRNLSLMPLSGVYFKRFCSWINLSNADPVNQLIDMGLLNKDQKGKISLHPLIQQAAILETHPSVSNCQVLLNSFSQLCMDKIGMYKVKSQDELGTILSISSIINKEGSVEDLDTYLTFQENAVPYLQQHNMPAQANMLIDQILSLLEQPEIGNQEDRSIMEVLRLLRNNDPVAALQLLTKSCLSGSIHLDSTVKKILFDGLKLYLNPFKKNSRPPVMAFLQERLPALNSARWVRISAFCIFLMINQIHEQDELKAALSVIDVPDSPSLPEPHDSPQEKFLTTSTEQQSE